MSQNYSEQPIEFITKATTMNSHDDPTALKENEVALLQNFVKNNGVFEVRLGKTVLNAGYPLGPPAECYGLSTFRPLDSTTTHYVAVCNARLYAGPSFPLTNTNLALSASTLMRLAPFNGRMLVNDPAKGMAWYDGVDVGWCGIPSPKENKLIEDYETITGWSVTNGTATLDDTTVLHGRHGIKFKTDSGATYSPRRTIISVSLTAFPAAPIGDAAASTMKDFIRLQLVRSFKADFTNCDLVLQSTTNNWSYFRISELPEWVNNDGPGLLFDLFIRKDSFITGAGTLNWANITVTGFDIEAPTGKQPFIIVDWLRLERSGPITKEYGKKITDFESDETWSVESFDYTYKTSLARSMKVAQATATYRAYSPVLDLTTMDSGRSADTIDAIELRVARNSSKVAGTLTIAFRDTAGSPVTASYAINAESILTPRIGTSAANGLQDPTLVFQTFVIRKFASVAPYFTNGDTINWASIDRVTLTASNHAGIYYVDEVKLVRAKDKKIIVNFESTDASPVVTNGVGKWSDKRADTDKIRTDEGSTESFHVSIKALTECTIDVTAALDLSAYASGIGTQDSDMLGLWIWISNSKYIEEISIFYDTSGGTFAEYYSKQLLRGAGQIPEIKKNWFEARFQKREHTQIPSSSPVGTWATVNKVRVRIATTKDAGVELYLDQWLIQRGDAPSGRFQFAVTYRNARGARSELSNISAPVEVKGGGVMLSNVPVSSGCIREVWQIGGLIPSWKLAGIIGDDESTYFESFLTEDELGVDLPILYAQPMIAKTFCIYNNLVIRANLIELSGGYRHKTAVAIGVEESIDEVDALSIFDVGKEDGYEILALIPFQDRIYVFKEKGIGSFDPYNLAQRPIWYSREIGILNPFAWAVDPIRGVIIFIGTDKEIYTFNGTSSPDDSLNTKLGNYTALIPDTHVGRVVGEYFNGVVYFSMPQYGDITNTTILVLDMINQCNSVFLGWPTSIFHVKSYAGETSLIGGVEDMNGLLFTLLSGQTDNTTVIVGIIKTADRSPDPTITGQLATLYLVSRKLSSTSGTILIEPWYDLADSGNNISCAVDDDTHKREEMGVPSPAYWPTYMGFKITTGTASVAIRSLAYSRRDEARR